MRRGHSQYGRGYPQVQQAGNLSYTETIPEYYGRPVEDYANVSQQLYQRNEQNRLAYEELALTAEMDLQNIRQEFRDGADGEAILNSISNIEGAVSKYVEGGNFHSAGRAISNIYRGYITDERRQAAIGARQAQAAHMEAINSMDLPQPYKEAAMAISNSPGFNRSIDEGGFRGWTPSEYVDINEMINKYMGNWSSYADSMEEGMWSDATGGSVQMAGNYPYLEKIVQRTSGISDEKVIAGITGLIASDPKAMAWLDSQYMMDNFDHQAGQLRQVSENELINTLPVPRRDDKGREIDRATQLENARNALQGIVNERMQAYEDMEIDVSEEQILQEIHKEQYMKNQMMKYVAGQGTKFAHTQIKIDHQIMQDYIFKGRMDAQSKGDAFVRNLGAMPEMIDPKELESNMLSITDEIQKYQRDLTDSSISEANRESIKENIKRLESRRSDINYLMQDLYNSVDDDTLKSIIDIKSNQLVNLDNNKIFNFIRSGDLDKLQQYIHDEYTGINVNPSLRAKYAEEAKHRYNSLISRVNKGIDKSRLSWHEEMISITPYNNRSADLLNRFAADLKENPSLAFVTYTGTSSTEKDYQKKIKGADGIHVHYTGNIRNGDLLFHVTWKKGDELLHSDLINSNQITGVNAGLGRDLIELSYSDKFKNHPEDAANIRTVGENTVVGFQPIYTDSNLNSSIGNFADVLRNYNLEVRDSFITSPMVFRAHGRDGIERAVSVRIEKKDNGRYYTQWLNEENRWMDIEEETYYNNIGAIQNMLYKKLYSR